MLFFIIVNLRGAGAFSRDFAINLSPQCRAFSRALKTEKLKAPLFPGPVGAGTTNDWCIKHSGLNFCHCISKELLIFKTPMLRHFLLTSNRKNDDTPLTYQKSYVSVISAAKFTITYAKFLAGCILELSEVIKHTLP